MNIKIVRLQDNEEIVCEVVDIVEKSHIVIKNPARFILAPTERGISVQGIIPWSFLAEEKQEYILNKSSVISIYEAKQDIKNMYNQQFGTGLVVPSQSLVSV